MHNENKPLTLPVLSVPQQQFQHRLWAILYGIPVMVWLATENNTVWLTALLGTGLSLMVIGLAITYRYGGRSFSWRYWLPGGFILGAIAGAGTMLCTVLLMFFKNNQHAHIVPDFSPEVILGLLERTPVWIAAGALTGGACVLLFLAVSPGETFEKFERKNKE